MNLDIHSLGFATTDALAARIRRRLGFALARHGTQVRRVAVRVGDENGPRGGIDKYCRIHVHLVGAPMATVEDVGADLYAVIDRAADRVGRVVTKHLDRAQPAGRPARRGADRVNRRHPAANGTAASDPAASA